MRKLFRLTTIDGSLYGLLEGQLKFLSRSFEVVGVADDSGILSRVEEREGVRVVAVPMRREISLWSDLKSLIGLIRLFRRERPYIVHANTPKASLLGMVAAWITRVPHRLYTVTGLRFETATGKFRRLLILMEQISCRCATKVIPEGDGVKQTLLREHITKKPLQKILNGNINGVNPAYFDRTPDVLEKAASIRLSEHFTFVFVGRMVRDKGVNELVAAFDKLSEEMPQVRLLLVGNFEEELDPLNLETKQKIAKNSRIEAVGFQSDVRPYLAASDVLVLPSYREGFPNVVLQGGAMSLPCLVTNINGSNEIIMDGVNGLIVPKQDSVALYDAMKKMATDTDMVGRMTACAREMIASRYAQQDVWQATLDMYKSLE